MKPPIEPEAHVAAKAKPAVRKGSRGESPASKPSSGPASPPSSSGKEQAGTKWAVEPEAHVAADAKPAARKRSRERSGTSKRTSGPEPLPPSGGKEETGIKPPVEPEAHLVTGGSTAAGAPPVMPPVEAGAPSRQPSLRFYHSESLRARTLGVLAAIEKAEDGRQHRKALADLVCELTDSGMNYYFLRPLKVAGAGFLVQQSANLGMGATTRILGSVIRNVIGGMDNRQLISVCGYIRQLME